MFHSSDVSLPGFERIESGIANFPISCKKGALTKALQLNFRATLALGDFERVSTDSPGMIGGLSISQVQRRPQREQGIFVALFRALECGAELRGSFEHQLLKPFLQLERFPFEEIALKTGRQFDPQVVQTFLGIPTEVLKEIHGKQKERTYARPAVRPTEMETSGRIGIPVAACG